MAEKNSPLFYLLEERVRRDREDGDIAYFYALTLELEYITKLIIAGVIACIDNDEERYRYSFEYKLIRANSLGDWVRELNTALTSPSAQYFKHEAREIVRQLTERVNEEDWRFVATHKLQQIATVLSIDIQTGKKLALRQFFDFGVAIRNRTRGHGATTIEQSSKICKLLNEAISLVKENFLLFSYGWVYLHRNYSGKYRVTRLNGNTDEFEYLKKTKDQKLKNGVYIGLGIPLKISLVFSDSGVKDIYLPNGNFTAERFESLSYISNDSEKRDGSNWMIPPGKLPESNTEGLKTLDQYGNTFSNIPQTPKGYIQRRELEKIIENELDKNDRHPIITLTGPGGIGKTSIAIAVIECISKRKNPPYDLILWMSSRDIDLFDHGPKQVSPRVVRKENIVTSALQLLEPVDEINDYKEQEKYFQECLTKGAAGSTLFVFDNFETLEDPADVFIWLDTYIRLPNKVLITTRFRNFNGDFPINIGGMTEEEAHSLISQESKRLGLTHILTKKYIDELYSESDGHPYVIKVLLGQVAREKRVIKPERIMANADNILTALFERTFESLSPAGQRVFLLLSSWRVFVPLIAVEAVSLREGNERFGVVVALEELRRFSLIEEVNYDIEEESFIGVPLAAATFGKRKLETSTFRISVEDDRKLLMEFGASRKAESRNGVMPKIERLIQRTADKLNEDKDCFNDLVPVLEYLASRVPKTYLLLSNLFYETKEIDNNYENAKKYIKLFIEHAEVNEKKDAWFRLARICKYTDDTIGEIHALSEAALLPNIKQEDLGDIANRINNRIRDQKVKKIEDSWSLEVQQFIEKVAITMEKHVSTLTATDCSRLAWLYLNIGNRERALDIAKLGIHIEPYNGYCNSLLEKLYSES